VWRNWQTRQV